MLKVGLEQLRRGRRQDLDANMRMEYRLVRRALMPDGDFHEGVRALLIDKDKTPRIGRPPLSRLSPTRWSRPISSRRKRAIFRSSRRRAYTAGQSIITVPGERIMGNALKIGFIGVGNMGGPMARNLVGAGHAVTVFDLSEDLVAKAIQGGASGASDAAEAVAGADVVITMLPAGPHVKSVYAEQVLPNAAKGALLIDCSTIDVETARDVAKTASDAGLDMVDAPVSGGVGGAEAGTLTFMVGGPDRAFDRAKPVSRDHGQEHRPLPAAPAPAQAAKICNNMMLGDPDDLRRGSLRHGRETGTGSSEAVRRVVQGLRAMLVAHHLLPGTWAGPDLSRQPRLRAGLHLGDDGKGLEPRPGRGEGVRRRYANRRRSPRDVRAICRFGEWGR
jgi:hypothetical protein